MWDVSRSAMSLDLLEYQTAEFARHTLLPLRFSHFHLSFLLVLMVLFTLFYGSESNTQMQETEPQVVWVNPEPP